MPKGIDKYLGRVQKYQKEKKELQQKMENVLRGNVYSKKKLQNFKAPRFLSEKYNSTKAQKVLIMRVEVSITPTKSGAISVHEGDKPEKLAQNFCIVHRLNK